MLRSSETDRKMRLNCLSLTKWRRLLIQRSAIQTSLEDMLWVRHRTRHPFIEQDTKAQRHEATWPKSHNHPSGSETSPGSASPGLSMVLGKARALSMSKASRYPQPVLFRFDYMLSSKEQCLGIRR